MCARPPLAAHLLWLDAAVLHDGQEQLRGQVAAEAVVAAQPLPEREHKLHVLRLRQGLVHGLPQRGRAEGRGRPPPAAAARASPAWAWRRSWGALSPGDRVRASHTGCGDPWRAPAEPLPQAGCRCRPSWPPQAMDPRLVARDMAAAASQLPLLWKMALQRQRVSSCAPPLAGIDRVGPALLPPPAWLRPPPSLVNSAAWASQL